MFVILHSKIPPPLVITLFLECCNSRFEEKRKNNILLPSEKEESQTLIRALISLQMHTMSQAISHSTTGESKSVRKGRRTQDLLQKHAIFISHKLSPHTHSQDLTSQECQAKEDAPHLGAFLSTYEIHSSKMDESQRIRCSHQRRIP